MNGLTWIDPDKIRFYRHAGGWLAAEWRGRAAPVAVKRLFPVSDPDGAITVQDIQGEEWGLLRSARRLEPESRMALEQELRMNPYFPRIQFVSSLRRRQQHFEWQVETDWGPVRFLTDPLYESVAEWPDGCRVVADQKGQGYLLPADRQLDGKSLKKLKRWL